MRLLANILALCRDSLVQNLINFVSMLPSSFLGRMAVMDREPFTTDRNQNVAKMNPPPPALCQPSFIFPNIFKAKNHKCQLFTGFSHFISSHLCTRRSFQRYWCSCSNFVRHVLHAIEILKTLTSCFLVRVPDRDCIFKLWPKEHMLGLFLEGLEFIL